jgi:hypothetical protein
MDFFVREMTGFGEEKCSVAAGSCIFKRKLP